jgi:hypothetical protein
MARSKTVTFMDGPLEGYVHKVEAGSPVPTAITRQDPKDRTRVYIYRVLSCGGTCHAFFDFSQRSEREPDDRA